MSSAPRFKAGSDLSGCTFGKWSVVSFSFKRKGSHYWRCRCGCGLEKDVDARSMIDGDSSMCMSCAAKLRREREDLAGMVFGKWTVLEFGGSVKTNYSSRRMWLCRCECGIQKSICARSLKSGLSTKCLSCAAKQNHSPMDLSDLRFGLWRVVGRSDKIYRGKQRVHWEVVCKCGSKSVISAGALRSGRSEMCSECWKSNSDRGGRKRYFGILRRSAKSRGIRFSVSMDEVFGVLDAQGSKCAMTGVDLVISNRVKNFSRDTTASLDRVDSEVGYEVGNIQWVHKHVNCMKWDLSQERFIDICNMVAEKHPRKR